MNTQSDHAWGGERKRAAISVTFDDLGEACDIAQGNWPADQPIGRHFTAIEVVPRFLTELDGLRVTYFIEASNVELYPRQLQALCEAGHEVGLHAWQHENWGRLRLPEQTDNLKKSLAAMVSVGIRPVGFRPPGGAISEQSLPLLKGYGFRYCSPVEDAGRGSVERDIVLLPFEWKHVDAYLSDPILGAFRVSQGDAEEPACAARWSEILAGAKAEALEQGKHLTIIFHPYMIGRDESLLCLARNLKRMAALRPKFG